MPSWLIIVLIVVGAAALAAAILQYVRFKTNLERSFNMVFLNVRVPKKESKEDREVEGEQYSNQKDFKEITGGIMTQFFEALYSMHIHEWHKVLTAQDFLSFEYAVLEEQVHFFIVCPRDLLSLVEKQLTAFFPDVYIEQVEDYNIFKPDSEVVSSYIVTTKP